MKNPINAKMLMLILRPNPIDDREPEIKEAFGFKQSKHFSKLSQVVEFVNNHKIASMTYLTQLEPDEDDNIRLSMQEIIDAFELGENPQDLYFF